MRMRRSQRATPRFLVRKGPRFYWQPPRYLRQLGLAPERLPDDTTAAWRRAEILNAHADAIRARSGVNGAPVVVPAGPRRGTVSWLIHRWAGDIADRNTPGSSPEWRRLAVRTREDYRRHLLGLRDTFGAHPLTALTPRVVHAFKRKLADPETGLLARQDRYRLQVLQALLAYGVSIGELASNPATRMRLTSNPPRRAYWTDADVERFLAVDPPPSIRLALMLGLWTGQRQADILHLRWSDISADAGVGGQRQWITLEQRKGRRPGRQAKKVSIPVSRVLAAELGRAKRDHATIITTSTGHPFRRTYFHYVWHDVTKRAGLDGLQFLDLRRSAVVRLASAGCSVGEIASFTGHSIAETQSILDTYFVPTRGAAEAALAKLEGVRTDHEPTH